MKEFISFMVNVAIVILISWIAMGLLIIIFYDPKNLQDYTWIMGIIDKLRALWWVNKPVLLLGIGALIGSGATALWSAWGKK